MQAKASVYIEIIEDADLVFQNFRIVTIDDKDIRYFTDDRYNAFYDLENEMSKYYLGDGVNVFFEKKIVYKNLLTIIYKKKNLNFEIDKSSNGKSFEVVSTLPKTNGCLDCVYFKKKNRICDYYQKFGIEIVNNCKDFRQKRENQNG